MLTILRIYGFRPLPPPPVGHPRDAHQRIKLPPACNLYSCMLDVRVDTKVVRYAYIPWNQLDLGQVGGRV